MLIRSFNKRTIVFSCGILFLLSVFLFSAFFQSKKLTKENSSIENNQGNILLKVLKTKPQVVETGFYSFGRVEPTKISEVISEVTSKVLERYVKEGTFVKKGQKIIKIERRDIDFNLESANKTFSKQKLSFEANQKLYDQKLISKKEYLDSFAEYEAAKASLEKIKAINKSYDVIAPFDGYVEKIYPKDGEMVFAGQTQLVKFLSKDDFYVVSYIPEEKRKLLLVGSEVDILMDDFVNNNSQTQYDLAEQQVNGSRSDVDNSSDDGLTITGKIDYVSNISDKSSKTFEVKVLVDKKNENYSKISEYFINNSGVTLKVFFKTGKKNGLFIPSSAMVLSDGGLVGIYLVDEKTSQVIFNQVEILKTLINGIFVSIKNNQKPPQKLTQQSDFVNVIIAGSSYYKEGDKVEYEQVDSF